MSQIVVNRSGGAGAGPVSVGRPSHHPLFAVGAVLLGSFLASVDTRLFSTGLPDLRGALSLSFDEGAWLGTAATASQILIAPAVAWLATVFGIRRMFVIPSLVYALISLLIPFCHDYALLLGLHVLRGLLLGMFVPATLMIIFRNLPMAWWLPAIALYAFRVGFTLNTGVSAVGFYVQELGWQWLYWQDLLLAPLMGLFALLGTPHEPVNEGLLEHADWGGMLLFGAGVALIYAGLDQGNRLDWFASGTIVALFVAGGGLLIAFFVNEAIVREPWASADVLFSRNIGLGLVAVIGFSIASTANASLVPNFLSTVAQLRPEQSGWLLTVWGAVPMVLLLAPSVILLRYVDPRIVMVLGFSAFALSSYWAATNLTHDWSTGDFAPVVLLQAAGYALTLLPVVMASLANSNPARATTFAAYIQAFRLGGSEIAGALMATWLRVREQVHSNLLGQHVTLGDSDVTQALSRLTGRFLGHDAASAAARGVSMLANLVQREANVLAYIDSFWLTFYVAVFALLVVALMTKAPAGPFSPQPWPRPARPPVAA
jgi:DHA2 family multidrug resistance protein